MDESAVARAMKSGDERREIAGWDSLRRTRRMEVGE
jgi:hypothetical protein